jgi:hypothetical protein
MDNTEESFVILYHNNNNNNNNNNKLPVNSTPVSLEGLLFLKFVTDFMPTGTISKEYFKIPSNQDPDLL